MQTDAVATALAQAHRSEWAFVLFATVRVTGDLDVAEESAQEAYVSALQAWTRDGVPERPGAWLTTAARNHALDRLRREVTPRRKLPLLVEPATVDPHDPADLDWPDAAVPDDRLRLVFTCCHPTLAPEARALALLSRIPRFVSNWGLPVRCRDETVPITKGHDREVRHHVHNHARTRRSGIA